MFEVRSVGYEFDRRQFKDSRDGFKWEDMKIFLFSTIVKTQNL
jgi:hypothetical protein